MLEHRADEAIITRGLMMFSELGLALKRIKERKSYRATHPTFDEYLADRWHYRKSYACRLINGAEIVKQLTTFTQVLPQNESQVRPLLTVPHDKLEEVWGNVEKEAKEGVVTAELVKKAAEPFQPKMGKRAGTKALNKSTQSIITLLDDLCYFIKESEIEKGLATVEKVRLAVLGKG